MTWKDKVAHFCVTASIFFSVAWLTNSYAAVICALLWSFGKEYYDEVHGGIWDNRDIVADLLGVVFALTVWSC